MLDTRHALADMAHQIRSCRAAEGLTLQQLATRSGVAASTIHKVEAGQMVPTVSILLKIARGLGRRPEELVRDEAGDENARQREASGRHTTANNPSAASRFAVWRIELVPDRELPDLVLEPRQRVVVLVEEGAVRLLSQGRVLDLNPEDCAELGGSLRIRTRGAHPEPARITLVASPPGSLAEQLGPPAGPRAALG